MSIGGLTRCCQALAQGLQILRILHSGLWQFDDSIFAHCKNLITLLPTNRRTVDEGAKRWQCEHVVSQQETRELQGIATSAVQFRTVGCR